MLARSAQGLYWMGRYLERAVHLSRMLRLQAEALVDRPTGEIYSGWRRIYRSLDREPLGGGLELIPSQLIPSQLVSSQEGPAPQFGQTEATSGQAQTQRRISDEYTLADSFTLADDLTFERANPSSVWSCFALGRENARQMRHCISAEMWRSLNLTYLKLQRIRMLDIWLASPEGFYTETAEDIETFMGVAGATMYRDEGWHFMQLGRFIERAQLASGLLLAQLELDEGSNDHTESDWTTVLRVYHAQQAYMRAYGVEIRRDQVLDLLVTDPMLPDSTRQALDTVCDELAAVGSGPDRGTSAAVNRMAGRLASLVLHEWADSDDKPRLLVRVADLSRQLHGLVNAAYFDYQY